MSCIQHGTADWKVLQENRSAFPRQQGSPVFYRLHRGPNHQEAIAVTVTLADSPSTSLPPSKPAKKDGSQDILSIKR